MEREKQIEEMAVIIAKQNCKPCGCENCDFAYEYGTKEESCEDYVSYRKMAEAFYNAGYRKERQGEWKHPPYAPFGGSYEMKRCSVCGYKPDFDSDNPYTKFCPNCGAKMKGAE